MIVRQDFSSLPPKAYLMHVLDNTSKVYVFLWETKDKNDHVRIKWDDLTPYFHKAMFKSSLRKLNNEGLLSYKETPKGISIDLVGWDTELDDLDNE
jgi:hypothetical protein